MSNFHSYHELDILKQMLGSWEIVRKYLLCKQKALCAIPVTHASVGMVATHTCDLRSGKIERGGSLEMSGQTV